MKKHLSFMVILFSFFTPSQVSYDYEKKNRQDEYAGCVSTNSVTWNKIFNE